MAELRALLNSHAVPTVFTREHDVLLLAVPFSLSGDAAAFTPAHHTRVEEALCRHFLRSARLLKLGKLPLTLNDSRTPALGYRLTADTTPEASDPEARGWGLLLSCAPNAHLALANLLEREAVFTVEAVGRVTLRAPAAPLH